MKKLMIPLTLGLFAFGALTAEIQSITVGWNAGLCDQRCGEMLGRFYKQVDGVTSVTINQPEGTAKLTWKPHSLFTWQMINVVMRRIGLSIQYINMEVRGTVTNIGENFYITSIGDNTKLQLLSLPPPSATQYTEYRALGSYKLANDIKDAARQAGRNHQLMTVRGYLFQPWRNPLALVVEGYTVHGDQNP